MHASRSYFVERIQVGSHGSCVEDEPSDLARIVGYDHVDGFAQVEAVRQALARTFGEGRRSLKGHVN